MGAEVAIGLGSGEHRQAELCGEVLLGIVQHCLIGLADADGGIGPELFETAYAGYVVGVSVCQHYGGRFEAGLLDGVGDMLGLGWEAGIDDPAATALATVEQVGVFLETWFDEGFDLKFYLRAHLGRLLGGRIGANRFARLAVFAGGVNYSLAVAGTAAGHGAQGGNPLVISGDRV